MVGHAMLAGAVLKAAVHHSRSSIIASAGFPKFRQPGIDIGALLVSRQSGDGGVAAARRKLNQTPPKANAPRLIPKKPSC